MCQSRVRQTGIDEMSTTHIFLLPGLLGLGVRSPESILGVYSQEPQYPEGREELKAQSLPRWLDDALLLSGAGWGPSVFTGCFPPQGRWVAARGP